MSAPTVAGRRVDTEAIEGLMQLSIYVEQAEQLSRSAFKAASAVEQLNLTDGTKVLLDNIVALGNVEHPRFIELAKLVERVRKEVDRLDTFALLALNQATNELWYEVQNAVVEEREWLAEHGQSDG
jgi:cell division septal protein FtsQ